MEDFTAACGGPSAEDGSQADPFTGSDAIQTAIDASATGDIIHVAGGTYDVIVFPAYDEQHEVIHELKIISDNQWTQGCNTDDAVIDGSLSPGLTGVFINGRQQTSVFEGFTVMNCSGGGSTGIRIAPTGSAGGPNGWGCSPTIRSCLITNNRTNGSGVYGGAGMQIAWHCDPVIEDCVFDGNYLDGGSGWGAAIWIYGALANSSTCDETTEEPYDELAHSPDPTISGCTFVDNYATYSSGDPGGAIAITCGRGLIEYCTFTNNIGSGGGGAIWGHLCDGTIIKDCVFEGNSAPGTGTPKGRGGAIYLKGMAGENENFDRVHLISSTFEENSAAEFGGAIFVENKDVTISHSFFRSNDGILGGAAIWAEASEDEDLGDPYLLILACNLFTANVVSDLFTHGRNQAVIYLKQFDESEQLYCLSFNNTIAENPDVRAITLFNEVDPDAPPYTSALALECSNEIMYFNADAPGLSLADVSIHDAGSEPPVLSINYCNAEQEEFPGDGNISTDPELISSTNLRLDTGSPCIDEGRDGAWDPDVDSTMPDTDLQGATRIQDAAIDMGCFET